MKKLTKKEKIMIGASIAVGAGLAVIGIKQQKKINELTKQIVRNSNDISELIEHAINLDQVMPDVIEVIDHVLYPNRVDKAINKAINEAINEAINTTKGGK